MEVHSLVKQVDVDESMVVSGLGSSLEFSES